MSPYLTVARQIKELLRKDLSNTVDGGFLVVLLGIVKITPIMVSMRVYRMLEARAVHCQIRTIVIGNHTPDLNRTTKRLTWGTLLAEHKIRQVLGIDDVITTKDNCTNRAHKIRLFLTDLNRNS